MVRIEVVHTFQLSCSEAFTYITDIKNWGDYWPGFIRIQDPTRAKWREPGDAVSLVLRLMGREVQLDMTLSEFKQDTVVRYFSRQQGLPDVEHERHFKAVSGGCEYRLVVDFEPRKGLVGLFDRLLLKRSVLKAMHTTVENLDKSFRRQQFQG